jgi:hypothetical protein
VAAVLGHITFWDGRALFLAGKLVRGEPFTAPDTEPEDVDWISASSRPLIHAIASRALAELAVSLAEETDELVASLPDDLLPRLDEKESGQTLCPQTTWASTWTRSRRLFEPLA